MENSKKKISPFIFGKSFSLQETLNNSTKPQLSNLINNLGIIILKINLLETIENLNKNISVRNPIKRLSKLSNNENFKKVKSKNENDNSVKRKSLLECEKSVEVKIYKLI